MNGNCELIFVLDHELHELMKENTVNKALSGVDYDTKVEACGHVFRTIVYSSLIEVGLWSKAVVGR